MRQTRLEQTSPRIYQAKTPPPGSPRDKLPQYPPDRSAILSLWQRQRPAIFYTAASTWAAILYHVRIFPPPFGALEQRHHHDMAFPPLEHCDKTGSAILDTLNKADSHAVQHCKVKVAILNPVPKSSPSHSQQASGNVTGQSCPSILWYHNSRRASNQPQISSSKYLAHTIHVTASACPAIHIASLFYTKNEQLNHQPSRVANLKWPPSFFPSLSNPLA